MNDFTPQTKATRTFPTQQTPPARQSAPVVTTVLTHDEIARRAYDIYVRKGRQQGHCKENWYQAEQDLRRQGLAAGAAQLRSAPAPVAHATGVR